MKLEQYLKNEGIIYKKFKQQIIIYGDLYVKYGSERITLPPALYVHGDANFSWVKNIELPKEFCVSGSLDIDSTNCKKIHTGTFIRMNLYTSCTKYEHLDFLRMKGGGYITDYGIIS